jgi:hypothetical protein
MLAFTLFRPSLVLVGLFVPATLASPAASKTCVTPFGQRLHDNVHAVPKGMTPNLKPKNTRTYNSFLGGRVIHFNDKVHLVDAAGTVLHVATDEGTKVRRSLVQDEAPQPVVALVAWNNTGGSPISSFTATWTVPPLPPNDDGQIIYIQNQISDASGNGVLQPSLQYGHTNAGGGSYWAVASWYEVKGNVYHTNAVPVSVGDALTGVIKLISGSQYNYTTSFSGINGTSLPITHSDQLVHAAEKFEGWVVSLSDYPASSTVFSSINLRTLDGIPSVKWTPQNHPNDGLTATVDIQGAINAQVTLGRLGAGVGTSSANVTGPLLSPTSTSCS